MNEPVSSEPLLPKIPLIALIGLVTLCAVVMGIVQQALTNQQTWSILASTAIAAMLFPVLIYVGSFVIANLFSAVGQAAVSVEDQAAPHVPTLQMPGENQE